MNKKLETFLSIVVALIFSVAAGFFIWFLGTTFVRHHAALGWVAVPAQVREYDLKSSSSRSGVNRLPTIQQRLTVTYQYQFNGVERTGNRVDFSFGSDNFSDERRSRQLAALRSGRITVFVDPHDPRESVFDRSLPGPQVVFALVFLLFPCGIGTAVGLGLVSAALARLGVTSAERYYLPVLGLFHSAPVLYPVIFAPGSVGFGGWLIMIAFLALLTVSLRSIWRRLQDPSIGQPQWSKRLNRGNSPQQQRMPEP